MATSCAGDICIPMLPNANILWLLISPCAWLGQGVVVKHVCMAATITIYNTTVIIITKELLYFENYSSYNLQCIGLVYLIYNDTHTHAKIGLK